MGIKKHVNTENIVAKNMPMKLTMAQKKSVIVLRRHIDLFDLTVPAHQNPQPFFYVKKEITYIGGLFGFNTQAEKLFYM